MLTRKGGGCISAPLCLCGEQKKLNLGMQTLFKGGCPSETPPQKATNHYQIPMNNRATMRKNQEVYNSILSNKNKKKEKNQIS